MRPLGAHASAILPVGRRTKLEKGAMKGMNGPVYIAVQRAFIEEISGRDSNSYTQIYNKSTPLGNLK
tara:strand:+ start:1116 stop:1316 length:201 start_codon:yes stop_codon:yes gene_type:complete